MTDTSDSLELTRLRAERDQLRAEVDRLQHHRRHDGWWRRTGAAVLVFLACVSFLAAVPGVWARRNFLDTDRFVSRVAPLIEEPAVQDAVSARLTQQLMVVIDPAELFREVLPERGQLLAVPLANAVEGFVADRVDRFVASDRFAELWASAVQLAHETSSRVLRGKSEVVTAGDGQVTLNLLPVIDAVLREITSVSPEILGRTVELPDVSVEDIPATAIARLERATGVDLGNDFGQVTVYDDGKLSAAQDAVRIFDRLVLVLLPLSAVLAAIALWISPRRRRTLLQLAGGVTLGMVLLRRAAFRFDDDIAALPPTAAGRKAAAVVVETFLTPLTTFAGWAIAIALVVAVLALLTGDYAWAVSLRHRTASLARQLVSATTDRAHDEATVAWIRQHRDALLAGGGIVGLFVLWTVDLSWGGLLLVLVLVGAFEAAVYRIAGAPETTPS